MWDLTKFHVHYIFLFFHNSGFIDVLFPKSFIDRRGVKEEDKEK